MSPDDPIPLGESSSLVIDLTDEPSDGEAMETDGNVVVTTPMVSVIAPAQAVSPHTARLAAEHAPIPRNNLHEDGNAQPKTNPPHSTRNKQQTDTGETSTAVPKPAAAPQGNPSSVVGHQTDQPSAPNRSQKRARTEGSDQNIDPRKSEVGKQGLKELEESLKTKTEALKTAELAQQELQGQVASLKTQISELEASNMQQRDEMAEAISYITEEVVKLRVELAAERQRVTDVKAECINQAATKYLDLWKRSEEARVKECQEFEEQLERERSRAEAEATACNQAKEQAAEAEAAISNAQQAELNVQNRLVEVQRMLDTQQARATLAEQNWNNEVAKVADLKSKLTATNIRLAEIEYKLSAQTARALAAEQRAADAQAEVNSVRVAEEEANRDLEQALNALRDEQARTAQLENNLSVVSFRAAEAESKLGVAQERAATAERNLAAQQTRATEAERRAAAAGNAAATVTQHAQMQLQQFKKSLLDERARATAAEGRAAAAEIAAAAARQELSQAKENAKNQALSTQRLLEAEKAKAADAVRIANERADAAKKEKDDCSKKSLAENRRQAQELSKTKAECQAAIDKKNRAEARVADLQRTKLELENKVLAAESGAKAAQTRAAAEEAKRIAAEESFLAHLSELEKEMDRDLEDRDRMKAQLRELQPTLGNDDLNGAHDAPQRRFPFSQETEEGEIRP